MDFPELKNGTWLLALSGGPDSAALYHRMRAEGVSFACAHVNYHVRPEADEEEEFVKQMCAADGIACHTADAVLADGENFEASAREFRYEFFAETVRKYGYAGILTGHQEDDLLETYIMQKEKDLIPETYGISPRSRYHGIPLVRPLLDCTKKQLQEYCDQNGWSYRIDSSNASDRYTRNRIRHTVLKELTEEERQALRQEIEQKNDALQIQRDKAAGLIRSGKCALQAYRETEEDVRLLVLFELYRRAGIYGYSRRYFRETDAVICAKNDFLLEVRDRELASDHEYFFLIPVSEPYEHVYETMTCVEHGFYRIADSGKTTEAVHITEEDLPVTVRTPRDGDAIRMRYGTKKIARFFIDRHIPLYQRRTWPVVTDRNGKVILLPGLGCSVDHYSTKDNIYVIQSNNTEENICGKTTTLKKY